MLGVIGGMGPLATADFFSKLVASTRVHTDDEHVPVLIHSVPQIPSRPAAILRGGASPLPALLAARNRLLAAGATALAMPCNTAHHWYDEIVADCPVPFLHIVDAVVDQLPTATPMVGMLATRATLQARIYEQRLARAFAVIAPDDVEYDNELQPAIDAVKRGDLTAAGHAIAPLVARLRARGAAVVILACTELPPALDAIASPARAHCIDATDALAQACVRWWLAARDAERPAPIIAAP
jgi:aspartate racemase